MHELVAKSFRALPAWVAEPEVSFAIRGERGVIDILAWHPARQMLLVIELKTDIADINELVGTADRKRRLAVEVAIERGWIARGGAPPSVSVWIIVAGRSYEPSTGPGARVDAAGGVSVGRPIDGRLAQGPGSTDPSALFLAKFARPER